MALPEWNVKKFEEDLERQIKRRHLIQHNPTNPVKFQDDCPCFDQFLIIGLSGSSEKEEILVAYPPINLPNVSYDRIITMSFPTGINKKYLSTNGIEPLQDEFLFTIYGGSSQKVSNSSNLVPDDNINTNPNYSNNNNDINSNNDNNNNDNNNLNSYNSINVIENDENEANSVTLYATCLHISLLKTPTPFFAKTSTKTSLYAFTMISRAPLIAAHFTFIAYLALSTLYQFELTAIPESFPPLFNSEILMDNLVIDDMVAHHQSIKVPDYIVNILRYYYTRKILTSPPIELGPSVCIFFPPLNLITNYNGDNNNNTGSNNSNNNNFSAILDFDVCLLWCAIDTLFSLLSSEIIVQLVSLLILDSQVLVIGSSLQEVSMTVLALQQLIRPFEFSGQIIPILPNSPDFLSLLESPTPFLIGVPPCPELGSFVFLDTAVFVHLDRRSVSLTIEAEFPDFKKVVKNINGIISKEKGKISHPFSFPDVFKSFLKHKYFFSPNTANRILREIQEPLKILYTDELFGFFVTDMNSTSLQQTSKQQMSKLQQQISMSGQQGVTVFNAELFLASVKKENRKYFRILIESQTFQLFIENRICDYLVKTRGAHTLQQPLTTEIAVSPEASITRKRTRSRSKSIHKDILCIDQQK